MDFEKVVKSRHSIRSFRKKEIEREKIEKILELANLSPSAGNLQARRVVIVKDLQKKIKLADACLEQTFIAEAPVVFVILADLEESEKKYGERGRKLYALQDATIFAAYLQLAATFLGLDSCWIGAFIEREIQKLLEIPSNLIPIAVIPVGYRDEVPYPTPRKSLKELILKEF